MPEKLQVPKWCINSRKNLDVIVAHILVLERTIFTELHDTNTDY